MEKLYIVEEICWGNTDNTYTPSVLHKFESEEKRKEFLDARKKYQFNYQHTVKSWDAIPSVEQQETPIKNSDIIELHKEIQKTLETIKPIKKPSLINMFNALGDAIKAKYNDNF